MCVEWPDSVAWTGVLNGLLTLLTRGRYWDETSGTITNVQDIAWEIFNRAWPYMECSDGQPLPPEIIEVIRHVGCEVVVESEADEMVCQGPNPPIKIEDGKLYFWWCCDWVEVGSLPGAASSDVEEPYVNNDPAPTYSACSKAKAIVDVIYLIADTIWENQASAPWQYVGIVEDAVTGHNDLDDNQIIGAFLTAIVINSVYDWSDVFDPTDKQQLLCSVTKLLADDAAGITRPQWDQMIGMIGAIYGEGIDDFFRQCAEAVGPSDMREITALMSLDQSFDCSCPEAVENPTLTWDTDWSHFWNFAVDDGDFVPNALTEWVAGQGWVDWSDDSTRYCKTSIHLDMTTETGMITELWIKVHVGTGFDYAGDTFRIETGNQAIYGPIPVGGDPVSVGGDFVLQQSAVNKQLTSADNTITVTAEGHTAAPGGDPVEPDSFRIIAFALGGTGADPWP